MVIGCGLNEKLFAVSEFHSHESQLLHNIFNRQGDSSILAKAGGAPLVIYQSLIDTIAQARELTPDIVTSVEPSIEVPQYKFGDIHKISFNHALGGKIPDFDRGPFPISGGCNTVNLQAWYPDAKQYNSKIYPSFRMVVPLSNVSKAQGMFVAVEMTI